MNYTGLSCVDIYNNYPETGNEDGYYPIINDQLQWTFCNMTDIADGNVCAGFGGNWRRIALINISAGDDCPTAWNKSSYNGVSFCRFPNEHGGCFGALFPTNGVSYQHFCGRARAYRKGSPDGFNSQFSFNSVYVEGLSITHGNPRQHIWTYAADSLEYSCCNCHCSVGGQSKPVPSYMLAIIITVKLQH